MRVQVDANLPQEHHPRQAEPQGEGARPALHPVIALVVRHAAVGQFLQSWLLLLLLLRVLQPRTAAAVQWGDQQAATTQQLAARSAWASGRVSHGWRRGWPSWTGWSTKSAMLTWQWISSTGRTHLMLSGAAW